MPSLKFEFAESITPKEIRKLAMILAGEKTMPRRKDRAAEKIRFIAMAGKNLSAFKKGAADGDMTVLTQIATDIVSNGEAAANGKAAAANGNGEKANGEKANGEKAKTGKRGRKSQFGDKTIRAKVTENPRRDGTHGHRSMQIVLDAGKKGIAYAEYIKAGGRNNDLAWDIAHDSVELADK